jgi:hypothetical protein
MNGTVENIQVPQAEKQFFYPFEWATADGIAVCHSFSLIHTAVIYVWRFTVLSSATPCIGMYYNSLRARRASPLQGCWLLCLLTWLTVTIILFTRGTGQNSAVRLMTGCCLAVQLWLWHPWSPFTPPPQPLPISVMLSLDILASLLSVSKISSGILLGVSDLSWVHSLFSHQSQRCEMLSEKK